MNGGEENKIRLPKIFLKLFVNKFKDFIPETLITRDLVEINKFKKEYKELRHTKTILYKF